MNIPTPALLAIIVLLGWPLIQLISVLVASGPRKRLKNLAAELRADPRFGEIDRKLIDLVLKDAKWFPGQLCLPFVVPIYVATDSYKAPTREDFMALEAELRTHQLEMNVKTLPVWSDPRYMKLVELAGTIEIVRSPITTLMTLGAFALAFPVFLISVYLRRARKARNLSPKFAIWSTMQVMRMLS